MVENWSIERYVDGLFELDHDEVWFYLSKGYAKRRLHNEYA